MDVRLEVKSLHPLHKVSSVQVVFDFLATHSIFAKELADNFSGLRNCGTVYVAIIVVS